MRRNVLVVGGGPAGLSCALALARAGMEPLVLERFNEFGLHKACGEGVSEGTLADIGLEASKEFISRVVRGLIFVLPNERSLKIEKKDEKGYMLNRSSFLKALSQRAIDFGAEVLLGTRATGLLFEHGAVHGVVSKGTGGQKEFHSDIVIGADGIAAGVARWSGMRKGGLELSHGIQYKMRGVQVGNLDYLYTYFGNKVAPGGYAWVFPKEGDKANVGVSVLQGQLPAPYLERFLKDHPEMFRGAEILRVERGVLPIGGMVSPLVSDGVMICGDSAGQVVSATGGGIHSSIVAGKIAGEVASKAINEGNTRAERLEEYTRIYDQEWGKRIRYSLKVAKTLYAMKDDELVSLVDSLSVSNFYDLISGKATV